MIRSSSHKNYKIGMIEETNYKSIEGNAHLLLKIPVKISFFSKDLMVYYNRLLRRHTALQRLLNTALVVLRF